MHRIARPLATLVVVLLAVGGAFSTLASAGSSGSSDEKVFATLQIENPKVEVKKKGSDAFKPAKDGQKLHAGDTVRTDATGLAEIDYSDDAYTRLDVNTTFKITKLTNEQGDAPDRRQPRERSNVEPNRGRQRERRVQSERRGRDRRHHRHRVHAHVHHDPEHRSDARARQRVFVHQRGAHDHRQERER